MESLAQTSSGVVGDNRTVQLDGARVVELRQQLALSREQLAQATIGAHGLSEATIKRAEQGARVYFETARRLAGMFGVQVESLLQRSDSEEQGLKVGKSTRARTDDEAAEAAIAVVPFRPLGQDPDTQTLAEGLAEDMTTRLGDWWFPVICRGSTSQYRSLDPGEGIADELRVGYLVGGSVQRRGDAVRVQARLLGAPGGAQLWASEYNRPFSKLFQLQDELAASIVGEVNHKLLALTNRELSRRDPADMFAWQLAARGCYLFHRGTREANRSAQELLKSAVKRDRDCCWAFYVLAMSYQRELINQWSPDLARSVHQLAEISSAFERHHPTDARAHVVAAYVQVYRGERERAADRLRQAIADAPNVNTAYSLLGQTMAMDHDPDAALEQFEIASRLSPRDRDRWSIHTGTALTYFVAEDYAKAMRWAESAARLRPEMAFPLAALASSSALAGDSDSALNAVQRMREQHGGWSQDGLKAILGSTSPDIAQRFLAGLRLAGLPA